MNRKRMSQVKEVSLDQLPKDGPIIIVHRQCKKSDFLREAGSVDGICALKIARFNLAQRYAIANGQSSRLILDTVNPYLLHHQPSSHQQSVIV